MTPLNGLQHALKVLTTGGVMEANPTADPSGYGGLLMQSHDHRVQEQRQEEDATPLPAGINPAQNNYFKTFNRGQQDAAMGPAGYNRQWAGYLEAPNVQAENDPHKLRMSYGSLDLPISSYSGAAGSQLTNPLDALRKLRP